MGNVFVGPHPNFNGPPQNFNGPPQNFNGPQQMGMGEYLGDMRRNEGWSGGGDNGFAMNNMQNMNFFGGNAVFGPNHQQMLQQQMMHFNQQQMNGGWSNFGGNQHSNA